MAKLFCSKRGLLLLHILQHIPMVWAVFGCTEQLRFRANLSHLTTDLFSWRLWPQRQTLLQAGNLFHISLTLLSSLLHPWWVPSVLFLLSWSCQTFSPSDIYLVYKIKFCQCYWSIFSYALLSVILLYLELLKYLSFLLVLLIKCSAT